MMFGAVFIIVPVAQSPFIITLGYFITSTPFGGMILKMAAPWTW